MLRSFREIWFESNNGLNLYARDYFSETAEVNVLCLHGLTRNAADFSDFCQKMPNAIRLIVPDQRGRGRSDYDPSPANYHIGNYVEDMFLLLDKLDVRKAIIIGTSMGGLMAMAMCALHGDRIAGVVLNDIGPDIEKPGLVRIKAYLGKKVFFNSWKEAAEYGKNVNAIAFPDYEHSQWLQFAKNTCHESEKGEILPSYDPYLAAPFSAEDKSLPVVDFWAVFAYMKSVPTVVLRGELSDILSPICVSKMQSLHPNLFAVVVPKVGHAPTLAEPEAFDAIMRLMVKC